MKLTRKQFLDAFSILAGVSSLAAGSARAAVEPENDAPPPRSHARLHAPKGKPVKGHPVKHGRGGPSTEDGARAYHGRGGPSTEAGRGHATKGGRGGPANETGRHTTAVKRRGQPVHHRGPANEAPARGRQHDE